MISKSHVQNEGKSDNIADFIKNNQFMAKCSEVYKIAGIVTENQHTPDTVSV